MTNPQINTALRDWLSEPMSAEHWTAIQIASHSKMLDESPVLREARSLRDRNRAVPSNFTESLDACRLIENCLGASQRHVYSARLMTASNYELAFATPEMRATVLCDVLGLVVTI